MLINKQHTAINQHVAAHESQEIYLMQTAQYTDFTLKGLAFLSAEPPLGGTYLHNTGLQK